VKYKLLALDVDGTLSEPTDFVDPAKIRAVARAQGAGLRVCLATGRMYAEVLPVWRRLALSPPHEPVILVGGALVSEPEGGRTLYQRTIPPELAAALADEFRAAGCCTLALVDAWRHGVDYLLTTDGDVEAVERMWLAKMDVRVRRVRRLADATDMPLLDIFAVPDADRADELADQLGAKFDGRLTVHCILVPNYQVMIVEAHARGADKFTALKYVAQASRITPAQIVAVGDDVNDLAMIRGAGLGVAMPGAPPAVREAADHTADDGLEAFVERLVAGGFDGEIAST